VTIAEPQVERAPFGVIAAPADGRCSTQNCGGYAHARITTYVTTQAIWDMNLVDEDRVELGLCRDCIAALAAGRDLEMAFLNEVSP